MSKFKVGDQVKIGQNRIGEAEGTVFTVKPYKEFNGVWVDTNRRVVCEDYVDRGYRAGFADFTYAEDITKPILEERKKDKIRMELVDQGFPNALLELAKVMTWANENKGYKDHDWKNIPNAENAFKGAAARHRVKFDAQRSFGNEMLECTDEESGIIHLAHEAFNVLALLELALVGKVR